MIHSSGYLRSSPVRAKAIQLDYGSFKLRTRVLENCMEARQWNLRRSLGVLCRLR